MTWTLRDVGMMLFVAGLFVMLVYEAFFDMAPRDVAGAYCRANGYESAANYEFTRGTFFVNCTETISCASTEECIKKNGMMSDGHS